uniref:Uncharacterized protein n=1 Tax=Glossina morsitans morsitans TaxID=37546 RepID=A0A1B0ESB6_GLOMM
MECCNKVELTTKEGKNICAPEGVRDDETKNETIVEIMFEDVSRMPFNSPTASAERNLARSSLFILLEKRCYSRKEKVKSDLEKKFKPAIDDKNDKHRLNDAISETSDLDYNDLEKEDTHNVNEASVSSNRCKTGISENYHWDEDDNDLFLSISTQEIPVNKQITQGNQKNNKNLVLRESKSNVALGLQKASGERPKLGEGKNAVGRRSWKKNELEEVKNKMHQHEMGKVNNP